MNTFIAKPASLGDLWAAIASVVPHDTDAVGARPGDERADAPAPEPAGDPGVDVTVLDTLASELGGAEVVASLTMTQCDELERRVAGILDPAAHGTDAKAVAHTLKSSSRLVGALALGDACAAIEKTGDASGVALRDLADRARVALLLWADRHRTG